jgi:hypothetical protein
MMPAKRGLIVEVTENDVLGGGGNPMSQVFKGALKMLALYWAAELKPHGIATIAVTPGFLRSESMLQHFGVTENNWRDGGKKDPNFLQSESLLFVGRAVAALAADSKAMNWTGMYSAPGSSHATTDSLITTADVPTGAAMRLISPCSRHRSWIISGLGQTSRSTGWARCRRARRSSGRRFPLDPHAA